jgi:hypothetical protein
MTGLQTGKGKPKAGTMIKAGKPTTIERILVAAVLGLAAEHQGKSPFQLLQLATRYWDADGKLRDAELEQRILVATVAKVNDEEHLFAVQRTARQKFVQPLPHAMWMERMENFPGDKHELLLELLLTEVPREELLKELFPRSDVSRMEEMKRLLVFAGRSGATIFVSSLAYRLAQSQPKAERDALLSAIATGDMGKAARWLAEANVSREHLDRLVFDLKCIKGGIHEGHLGYHMLDTPVPGLICRWLIDARQRLISRKRANAARRKQEKEQPAKEKSAGEKPRKGKQGKAAF